MFTDREWEFIECFLKDKPCFALDDGRGGWIDYGSELLSVLDKVKREFEDSTERKLKLAFDCVYDFGMDARIENVEESLISFNEAYCNRVNEVNDCLSDLLKRVKNLEESSEITGELKDE